MTPNKCGQNELIKRSNIIKIVNRGKKQHKRLFQNTNFILKQKLRNTLCACTTLSEYDCGDWKSVMKRRHRISCLLTWEPSRIFLIEYPWISLPNRHSHPASLLPPSISIGRKCRLNFSDSSVAKKGHVTIFWPVSCKLKSLSAFLIKSLIIGTNFALLSAPNMGQQEPICNHEARPEACPHTFWHYWAAEPPPDSFYL